MRVRGTRGAPHGPLTLPLSPFGCEGIRIRVRGVGLAVALALLSLAPAAEAAVLDRIAAVVNNDVITLSEV
ncbi:MAG TPA: hypothetical protein VED18_08495, partial [Candidatus Sulfotelmatobacter sp.]|nr:hypothetical protein [Candidatus Sulfotelmatobacter sp.]